jgi:hypothetical protein
MNASSIRRHAAALLVVLSSGPALAVDPDELNLITFQNRTGENIRYLFLSPGDSEYWGTDILGSTRVLGDGDDLGFFIHYPDRCNEFDIYAVGASGSAFLLYGYEICDGEEADVRLSRGNLKNEGPDFSYATVRLDNETDYDIWYLFFSPGDSQMWGVDQLDRETILTPGESLSVLLPIGDAPVRYDVRAVDEDEDSYTFYVEVEPGQDEFIYSIENSDLD